MIKLLGRLKEPFPDRASFKQSFMGLLGVSVFVSSFLYLLRPFGISGASDVLFLVCLGFGLVTLVFGTIFDLVIRYLLKIKTDEDSWTLGKWILQSIVLLLWIALGNYLFLLALSEGNWERYSLAGMLLNTLIVGIFPVIFSGLVSQVKAASTNEKLASQTQIKRDTTVAEKNAAILKVNEVEIQEGNILFAEAQQNYVAIYYKDGNNVKKELYRITLKELEDLLGSDIVRCHRSYLVNLKQVENVKGNAQGLRLSMVGFTEKMVPVSRSHLGLFK